MNQSSQPKTAYQLPAHFQNSRKHQHLQLLSELLQAGRNDFGGRRLGLESSLDGIHLAGPHAGYGQVPESESLPGELLAREEGLHLEKCEQNVLKVRG